MTLQHIRIIMAIALVVGHLFVIPVSLAGIAYYLVSPEATLLPLFGWLLFANIAYRSKITSKNIFERDAAYLFFKAQAVLLMFVLVLSLMVLGSVLG